MAFPRFHTIALALALFLPTATPAEETVTVADARFETTTSVEGRDLALAGTGVATYRVVFTVYAAALYTPPEIPRDAVLAAETPRRLVIEYFYEIAPEDIIRAANTVLRDQLSDDEFAAIEERLRRFQGWFEGVEPGDRYTMTYTPGAGTALAFNGETVGRVEGADFAAAYFGIWLGESPLSESLRRDLLARLDTDQ